MGNVQCCASGRFPEGKPPNKPKEKKKTKGLKGVTKKTNGAGAGKGNGTVQKLVAVAEDGSKRAAPALAEPHTELLSQAAPPSDNVPGSEPANEHKHTTEETDAAAAPNESIAVARERFFNEVGFYLESISVVFTKVLMPVTIATIRATTSGVPRDELIPLS
ncbi:Uncharacterized protein OBRU01_01713 [Operophtera brumata]|uniref:Uncharacterized protein n=1 Tax=Operophtera brumata TaxID=104452 RepID=A0A0L7LP13_OPEBR|nr:Uncharacterized protein OBRU01_01713 [Operophtera brumata]